MSRRQEKTGKERKVAWQLSGRSASAFVCRQEKEKETEKRLGEGEKGPELDLVHGEWARSYSLSYG